MWLKTLLIESDSQTRMLMNDILVKCGWEVVTARDSQEALEKLTLFEPDLILMEIQIPGLGGFEALAHIRQALGTRNASVIAMTSPAIAEEMQKTRKKDFDGYLIKPIANGTFRDFIVNFRHKRKYYGAKAKILCVDDEPLNLKLLEAILVPAGYQVISVKGGYEAFLVLKQETVDLVLLDVMIPEMDGYEICRRIKASAGTAQVPVIMITALSSKEDRIKSIEAGAEDFISKPFEIIEVLTRIKKLLEIKEQNSKIILLFGILAGLAERGNQSAELLTKSRFDFIAEVDTLIRGTILGQRRGPRGMLLGTVETGWVIYDMTDTDEVKVGRKLSTEKLAFLLEGPTRVLYANNGESSSPEADKATHAFAEEGINAGNFIYRAGSGLCLVSFDFQKAVNDQDAVVLKAIVMQILFMRSVHQEIKETEKAFDYIVFTLARVAEANDEDTGLHILRVGEYAGRLAEKMGLDAGFVERIKMQAQLHDVGKIQIPLEILRKAGALTTEEFDIIKMHTVYGEKIIGKHDRLSMGNKIAMSHHERWDGSGYPAGLKATEIPLEARITAVADQYDALRNARAYKPAFSHEKTYEILVKGDGRTKPEHFDPEVLSAFKAQAKMFEDIYNKLKEKELDKKPGSN